MASNSSVATDGTEDACWGPPQTRNLGPCWPEVVASLCSLFSVSLSLLFFLFVLSGIAQQIINVCFRRVDFLHIPPYSLVLSIELPFLLRQPPAFLL